METNKRWMSGVLAGLIFVITYVAVLYKYEMLSSLYISLAITISAVIISGIMAWGMNRQSVVFFAVIVTAFCLIMLCLSVLLTGGSIGRYCLYNKSIQDFASIYEMESIKSLDGKYQVTSFMYDSEEGNEYTVFVRMKDLESNKARNIYLEEQENLDVNMKWLDDAIVKINGRKIHINKEVYDGRVQ